MSNSKLTSKFQTTTPQDIRSFPKRKADDRKISEAIQNQQVIIKKAIPLDIAFLKALESTLSEWNSANDAEDCSH